MSAGLPDADLTGPGRPALPSAVDDADAEVRVRHRDALDDVVRDLLGPVRRDGEADADVAVAPPLVAIAVLMPTTSPFVLTSAPPELPGLIAASVWIAPAIVAAGWRALVLALAERVLRLRVGRLVDGAVERADDAGGDRAVQAERAADGEDRVADLQRVAVAELRRRSGR